MTSRPVFAIGAFRLDTGERLLSRDGRPVPLPPKAIETLLALVERPGRLVTKDELLQAVWPDTFVEENNLAQHISTLRRVFAEGLPDSPVIETVPRRGYRFVGPVAEVPMAAGEPVPVPPPTDQPSTLHPAPEPDRPSMPWRLALAVGLPLCLLVVAAGLSRRAPVDAGPTSVVHPGPARPTRLAVLPFANLGAPDESYFAAGMTEEITRRLAGLSGVSVPSSATIAAYRPSGRSPRDVASDLGVDYLVTGTSSWEPSSTPPRVRIAPTLVRASDGATIWTQAYDAALPDVSTIQAEIAFQIAGALRVAVDAADRARIDKRHTSNDDAYLAYLQGLAAMQQGPWDTANLASARASLERAVTRDPGFALAWSLLASVLSNQYNTGAARVPETRRDAYRAVRTALELEPGLPEGRLAMAQLLVAEGHSEAARRELNLAGVGLPRSPARWRLLGILEQNLGRWRASREALEAAFEVDPLSVSEELTVHHLLMRDYAEARRFLELALTTNRSGVAVPAAWERFSASGDLAAARALLERALAARPMADGRVLGLLARLEWFDGRYDRALALIDTMDSAGSWMAPNFRFPAAVAAGQIHESMGRPDLARASFLDALTHLQQRRQIAANDFQVEAGIALASSGLGRHDEALQHARRAVELCPMTTNALLGHLYLYLLAQVQSRAGDQAASLRTLDALFELPGFYNEHWVGRDPWFAALRAHPQFAAHAARWATRRDAALGHDGT